MAVPSTFRLKTFVCAVALTLFLLLSFKTESIWTDEAFSAFIACHKDLASLCSTLAAGDSSDLQMWLYYVYLHGWVSLFGSSEFALRSANIPFIFFFSYAIAWIRTSLFNSNWIWLAALNPFLWAYAADARPYMSIVALSTIFLTCLIAVITDPRHTFSRLLPWAALSSLLIGLNMHMLMILLLPPSCLFVLVYRWTSNSPISAKPWIRPALVLSPLFLSYFVFLGWTFERGASYDYAHPDLLSMASVLFRFAGLSGFAPNRHYDIPLSGYVFGMTVSSVSLLAALAFLIWPALRKPQARTRSLLAGLAAGICEAFVLSFVFKQQIEVRHLACLFAFFLFLVFANIPTLNPNRSRLPATIAMVAIATVWLVSDFRLTFLPEYNREDFRDAVALAIALAKAEHAQVAVVADPAAVAYYGLSVEGASPCFPLPGSCQAALARVPWPQVIKGTQATFWTPAQISAWLQHSGTNADRVVLISRSRHPMYAHSFWWFALGKTRNSVPTQLHGFFVYNILSEKY